MKLKSMNFVLEGGENMQEQEPEKEIVDQRGTYQFSIYKPGGNDTCLVEGGIPKDAAMRKMINDLIMQTFPNVEQVGFVDLKSENPELMMAGGEFCGNATRSTAWQMLNGNAGTIEMKVSGVAGRLKAGVNSKGEGFAQMPIYCETSKIVYDGDCFIVEMEGITHLIDFNEETIKGLSKDEIKRKAKETMRKKGLLEKYPATGVIYTTKTEDGFKINPVVYVRDIDTLFYESACGSGTTALGALIALQRGKSIKNLPILQPSGLPISVSIDYDGKTFSYAQIEGPIKKLRSGTIEIGKGLAYVVEKIANIDTLNEVLESDDLIQLYKDVFAQAPYFEKFDNEEVREFFTEYVRDGMLFLARASKNIIGFGAALPLSCVPQIAELVDFNPTSTWYMADLGVKEEYRRLGIARKLVEERLRNIPDGNSVIMRTSIYNIPSQSLYYSLGFQRLSTVTQGVEQKRVDGSVKKDQRIFLAKL